MNPSFFKKKIKVFKILKEKQKKQEFFAKGKQAGSISFKFIAVWKFGIVLISFD